MNAFGRSAQPGEVLTAHPSRRSLLYLTLFMFVALALLTSANAQTDYGDAPTTYGTASHTIQAGSLPRLGAIAPDADSGNGRNGTVSSTGADEDDTNDAAAPSPSDDEDATGSLPVLTTTDSSYTLTVPLQAAQNATLAAWIDFNRDGTFAATEGLAVPVTSGQTSATLTFSNLPARSPGRTYVRLRIANGATLTTSTPTGAQTSGEVEDHPLLILAAPTLCQGVPITALNFNDTTPTLISGANGSAGAEYRFQNVVEGIDAIVKIDAVSAGTSLNVIDDNSGTGDVRSFQPQVNSQSSVGYIDFTITFVIADSRTPYALPKFFANAIDVDGNGATQTRREYVELSGFTSFELDDPTNLSSLAASANFAVGALTKRRFESNIQDSLPGVSLAVPENIARAVYDNTSSLKHRAGSTGTGTTEFPFQHSLFFQCVEFGPTRELSIDKQQRVGTTGTFGDAPLSVAVGNTVQYQLTVTNNSLVSAKGPTFSDVLPSNLTNPSVVSVTPSSTGVRGCSATLSGNTLSGSVALAFLPNTSCTVIIQATVSTAGVITNTTTVSPHPNHTDTNLANNSDTVTATTSADYGDAPDSAAGTAAGNYQTTLSDNGPSHIVATNLRLGAVADIDTGTLQNAAATADDTSSAPDDEDGLGTGPSVSSTAGQVATVPVAVTNTTGANAYLAGFIDFNKNGNFEAGERAAATVTNGATSASLSFTTPTGTTTGTTYLRLRLSSAATEVATAVGAASSGEVEDYQVTLVAVAPDLSVTKTSNSFVRGSAGTYTVTVTNGGNLATNAEVRVTDVLPTGLTFVSATGTGWTCSYDTASRTVTCTRPAASTIAASGGSAPPITLTVSVNQSAPASIENTANVSGGGELNTGNNAGPVTTTVTSQADLEISKTGTTSATVGGAVSYTLTVRNNGPSNVTGAVITDTVPSAFTGVSWTCAAAGAASCGAASGGGNNISLTGNLNAGAGNSLTITVMGTASTSGSVTNTATVAPPSGTADPATGNDSSSVTTAVLTAPDLSLTKADTGSFTVGGTGTYSFTVTNGGGSATSGEITVTDTLPTGLTYAGPVGGANGTNWSCSANALIPQTVTCMSSTAIAATGSSTFTFGVNVGVATAVPAVTNTAAVVGGGDTTSADSNSDQTTVLSPNLTVSKTHTGSFIRSGRGSYTLTVSNSGSAATAATSSTVTVTDTLPTGLSVTPSPPNLTLTGTNAANWTCTANNATPQVITCTSSVSIPTSGSSTFGFSVAVATTTAASVTNEARVSGGNEATANDTAFSATTPSNTARDVTATVDAGSLTLSKTVRNVTRSGPTGVTSTGEPGDVLEYCITYTNPGGSTVTSTVLLDTVPLSTTAVTSVPDYANKAVRWSVTAPTPTTPQNLSAAADPDAGELNTLLTVRLGSVPPAGAGAVCFQVTIN